MSSASGAPFEGVRALVLGASGFIGRWVARALAARGAAVVYAVRDRAAFEPIRRAWSLAGPVIEADLSRPDSVGALLREVRPSVTFNLAGYGVDRCERDGHLSHLLNAELPGRAAEAMAAVRDPRWPGVDLVHTGSALEYGTLGGDLAEDSLPQPTTVYGKSKLAGTRAVAAASREHGLKAVTARLFTVYGPGEHTGRLLPTLLEAARGYFAEQTRETKWKSLIPEGTKSELLPSEIMVKGDLPSMASIPLGSLDQSGV